MNTKDIIFKKKYLNQIQFIKKKNFTDKVFLHEPHIDKEDIKLVIKNLKQKNLSTYGKTTKEFENKLSKYLKVKQSLCLINGTSALHLSLKVLNIESSNEVLVPSLTYISSVNSIVYNGATPHFYDVSLDTMSVDLNHPDPILREESKKLERYRLESLRPSQYQYSPASQGNNANFISS